MLTVLTPPTATRAATVQALLDELGETVAAVPVLGALLDAASAAAARYCGRVWGRARYQEQLRGTGSAMLYLARVPVVAVESVLDDTTALTDAVVADADAGQLYRADGWGGRWPHGHAVDHWPYPRGWLRYTVTYTAGYVLPEQANPTLPADVERAVLETVKSWWHSRGGRDLSVRTRTVGDVSVTYASGADAPAGATAALPPLALTLLAPYRRSAWAA